MKQLIDVNIRSLVREEIERLFREKKESYEGIKHAIKPEHLKANIRNIISTEMKGVVDTSLFEFKKEFEGKLLKFMKIRIDNLIKEKIRDIDIPFEVIDRFNEEVKTNFEPIIKKAIDLSDRHVRSIVKKRIRNIINLKTSTISQINTDICNNSVMEEEEFEKIEVRGDMLMLE